MDTVFPPPNQPTVAVKDSTKQFPVRRIFCVGRNYADHAREMGANPDREAPFFFTKAADTVAGNTETIAYPSKTADLHHEVEMVIALKKGGQNLSEDEALDCIYGYAVGIDLTRRDLQAEAKALGRPWCTAKAFDQSALIGPITNAELCGHIDSAEIVLEVNGQITQSGNVNQMIWSSREIISILSSYFTLESGDLIYTGTPAGVGPLKRGDKFKAWISGLAPLENKMV